MQFKIKRNNLKKGKILYNVVEGSFDSTPLMNTDINISIEYLNIGIDSTDMEVKCIWGYNPKIKWFEKDLNIPYAEEGSLMLFGDYKPGLSIRLDRDNIWRSYIDRKTEWFCIGNANFDRQDETVKINDNTIVVVSEFGELKAIFIHLILD